jgi:nucleoid-associated protein YgaU
MTAWAMIVVLGLGFAMLGCQEKKEEPAAQAPVQQPVEKFPEAQVPPPEPQPQPPAAASVPPAPPVDTTAEKPAATSGHKAKQQPKESYSSGEKKAARTYTVKKGDTLQKISEKFYGTTKHWRRICDANKKVVKDCDKLEPGTKLVIP